mmetsp:Transcript_19203/g.30690  ORF Transcript_19203/g.30690 Transcript_19203/m.30690 type:complete len:100 (-) Transcript_19203:221-520(-)
MVTIMDRQGGTPSWWMLLGGWLVIGSKLNSGEWHCSACVPVAKMVKAEEHHMMKWASTGQLGNKTKACSKVSPGFPFSYSFFVHTTPGTSPTYTTKCFT